MKVKAIAIGTPSGDRYSCAASNFARGDISCFARIPFRLAGDSRKILGADIARTSTQPAQRLFHELRSLFLLFRLRATHQLVGMAKIGEDREKRQRIRSRKD